MPGDAPVTLRHLNYSGRAQRQDYKARAAGGGADFTLVPRQRAAHAAKLRGELHAAETESDRLKASQELASCEEDIGINLEIRGKPNFPLSVEPFDAAPKSGVALKNVRFEKTVSADGAESVTTIATVFVRHGKLSFLAKRIEDYAAAEKNKKLIANIESIGIAAIEAFWTSRHPLPEMDVQTWWEVWVRVGSDAERDRHENAVLAEAQRLGMERRPDRLTLREHSVFLIKTSRRVLASATAMLNFVSELRHPAETAQFFIEETPSDQQLWAANLLSRVQLPDENAPAVCVLDTGVNRGHPLLADILAEQDHDTVREEWGRDDFHVGSDGIIVYHGTGMAGLAAYGDLTPLLETTAPVPLSHHVESVKILPRVGDNEPEHYGPITQAAMSKAELNSPNRSRVFALAVTAGDAKEFAENGRPSAWSSAIDSYASGAMENGEIKRIICVSGGNAPLTHASQYPSLNAVTAFGDPAQAWNAISVGAFTEKDVVTDANGILLPGARCIAPRGGLAPHSATTCLWTAAESKQWPLKPDVVFEGGNAAANAAGEPDAHDSLSLLTTHSNFQARLFAPFGDTSAATALAARMTAQIQAAYPDYWPETVRALLIHSADWTDEMKRGSKLGNKGDVENIIQRFGHGVPSLTRALASARSRATLICQDSLQPFEKTKEGDKTRDMMLYRMPWPKSLLQQHDATSVRLRVTLSYFIEPNPGSRVVTSKYRYAGCNLRFATQTPTDKSLSNFIARVSDAISKDDRDAYEAPGDASDGWILGDKLRRRGSVHSDTWTGTAAQLVGMEHLIVHPVNGWWRRRKQHDRCNHRIRYGLVVTLETVGLDLDIFTPISQSITASVSV